MKRHSSLFTLLLSSLVFFISCTKEDENYYPDVTRDVVYGRNTDTSGNVEYLSLNLYYPYRARVGNSYPLYVCFHGGGYLMGSRNVMDNHCFSMRDSGFICASIEYRLGWRDRGRYDSDPFELEKASYRAFQDANSALRFLVHHAAELGIDTSWIFLGGNSAGGCIALNSACLDNSFFEKYDPSLVSLLGKLDDQGNEFRDRFTIKGISNLWGSVMDTNELVSRKAIPVISFHGMADELIPVETGTFLGYDGFQESYGSLCIYRQLTRYSVPSVAVLVPGAGHMPVDLFTDRYVTTNSACFFHKLMHNERMTGMYHDTVNTCR